MCGDTGDMKIGWLGLDNQKGITPVSGGFHQFPQEDESRGGDLALRLLLDRFAPARLTKHARADKPHSFYIVHCFIVAGKIESL